MFRCSEPIEIHKFGKTSFMFDIWSRGKFAQSFRFRKFFMRSLFSLSLSLPTLYVHYIHSLYARALSGYNTFKVLISGVACLTKLIFRYFVFKSCTGNTRIDR